MFTELINKKNHSFQLGLGGSIEFESLKQGKYKVSYLNNGISFPVNDSIKIQEAADLVKLIRSYKAKKQVCCLWLAPIHFILNPVSTFQKLQNLFEKTCKVLNVEPEAVMKVCRKSELLFARQLFFYICHIKFIQPERRRKPQISGAKIGEFLGKDHTTFIHSIKVIKNYLYTGQKDINLLISKILEA